MSFTRHAAGNANATAAAGEIVCFAGLTATRVCTLPARSGVTAGAMIAVCDEDGSCTYINRIKVTAAGTDKINNSTVPAEIAVPDGSLLLVATATANWTVLAAWEAG